MEISHLSHIAAHELFTVYQQNKHSERLESWASCFTIKVRPKGMGEMYMPYEVVSTPLEQMTVEAIVNPTNLVMQFTNGVSERISAKAGPALQQDCAKLAPLHADEILITQGYRLPTKWIFHIATPRWIEQGEEAISLCYARILQDAVTQRIQTIAIPILCADQIGFPAERGVQLAEQVIAAFLEKNPQLTIYLVRG